MAGAFTVLTTIDSVRYIANGTQVGVKIHETDDDSTNNQSIEFLKDIIDGGGTGSLTLSSSTANATINVSNITFSSNQFLIEGTSVNVSTIDASVNDVYKICIAIGVESGSSGTSGSSGSSGTSGLAGAPSCVNQELEAFNISTAPGDYKFKVNNNSWNTIDLIWADFDAVVNGLDIPLGYYNSFENVQGFQASLIITEIGGTDYATYAVGSFSNSGGGYFEIKTTYVNGSGSPTIGEDYCFAFQQAI